VVALSARVRASVERARIAIIAVVRPTDAALFAKTDVVSRADAPVIAGHAIEPIRYVASESSFANHGTGTFHLHTLHRVSPHAVAEIAEVILRALVLIRTLPRELRLVRHEPLHAEILRARVVVIEGKGISDDALPRQTAVTHRAVVLAVIAGGAIFGDRLDTLGESCLITLTGDCEAIVGRRAG